ncbi:MAG: LCP family protein [Anaerolineae bacterium]|nr:LCP family protein [Anaerolineae bacterium]
MAPENTNNPNEPTLINGQPVQPQHEAATQMNLSPYYSDKRVLPPPPSVEAESAARERIRRRRVKPRRQGAEWAWAIIALTMLGIVVIIGMSISLLLRTSQGETEFIPTAAVVLPTPVNALAGFNAAGETTAEQIILNDGRSLALTPWNGVSRLTVLFMGLDRRPGETGLAYRTDTMMLVSVDPVTNSIGILSIPRDLYVEVPGYSELQRVNSSMVLGELERPDYGPDLAMQTVQYNLGIRIHDYVVIDFNAFTRFIDAIGGITVDIPYNISDPFYPDMNYGYDPFYIRAGLQQLDGTTALKYARTRHGDNDFQRAQRQQLILYAIRDKVLDAQTLPQLIIQSPSIWSSVSDGIYTGLTLEQIIQLGLYLKDIPFDNIKTGVINELYTIPYSTSAGASVLVPDRARIGPLMVEVFGADYSQ